MKLLFILCLIMTILCLLYINYRNIKNKIIAKINDPDLLKSMADKELNYCRIFLYKSNDYSSKELVENEYIRRFCMHKKICNEQKQDADVPKTN